MPTHYSDYIISSNFTFFFFFSYCVFTISSSYSTFSFCHIPSRLKTKNKQKAALSSSTKWLIKWSYFAVCYDFKPYSSQGPVSQPQLESFVSIYNFRAQSIVILNLLIIKTNYHQLLFHSVINNYNSDQRSESSIQRAYNMYYIF